MLGKAGRLTDDGPLPERQEDHVANKDKGGSGKSDKKQSQKTLKEKRAAKKQKKGKAAPPSI